LQIFCALALTVNNKEQIESYYIPYFQKQKEVGPIKLYGGSVAVFEKLNRLSLFKQIYENGEFRIDKYQFIGKNMYYYTNSSEGRDDVIRLDLTEGFLNYVQCKCKIEGNSIILYDFYYQNKPINIKQVAISLVPVTKIADNIYKTLYSVYEYALNPRKQQEVKKPASNIQTSSFDRYEFINEIYVKKLAGHQTMPYAIARAHQLIDLNQVVPTSYVNDFTYPKLREIAPYAVKEGGMVNLRNVLGISALDKLYYDQINGLEIESMGHVRPNKQVYYKFLQKINCIFSESIATTINMSKIDDVVSLGLKIFNVKNPPTPGPKQLPPNENKKLIQNLLKIQQELFAFQLAHTRKVMGFIQANFIQTTPAGIYLNPKIQKGGFQYINWLGEQTRNMLLEYYMRAETIYNKGSSLVNGKEPTNFVEKCRSL
jgi:hypothetical protein